MWPHVNLRGTVKDSVDCTSGGSTSTAAEELFVRNADVDPRLLLLSPDTDCRQGQYSFN